MCTPVCTTWFAELLRFCELEILHFLIVVTQKLKTEDRRRVKFSDQLQLFAEVTLLA